MIKKDEWNQYYNNNFEKIQGDKDEFEASNKELKDTKQRLLGDKEYDLVAFFNSRNIRRKSISDLLVAWKLFKEGLPKDKQNKVALILHTAPVDDNGTDLYAVRDLLLGEDPNILFSSGNYS